MGCNVSKDVKVEDQTGNAANGGDVSAMSEEKAAEKIQASFRGYKARKSLKNNGILPVKEESNEEAEEKSKEEKSSANPNPTTENDELLDIDLSDKDLEKAAAKIQASYRQFSEKKRQQQNDDTSSSTNKPPLQNDTAIKEEEEEVDIDLGDPEVEKAALKIQSTFRGYKKTRIVKDEPEMANGEKEA